MPRCLCILGQGPAPPLPRGSHQVCQVGLLPTHELLLLADGGHPFVDGLVEVLPHVILEVVSAEKVTATLGIRRDLLKTCLRLVYTLFLCPTAEDATAKVATHRQTAFALLIGSVLCVC